MRKHPILRSPDVAEAPSTSSQAQPTQPQPSPATPPQGAAPSPVPAGDGFSLEELNKLDEAFLPKAAPEQPKETPEPKPDAKKDTKAPEAKADPKANKPVESGPKQLREKLSSVEKELETERKAKADLERRIQEKEAQGKDSTALTGALAEKEKEIESLRAEMRGLKFTASPEFKKNYEQPFAKAITRASKDISSMQVGQYVKNEATDQMEFQPAQGVKAWDDTFARIYSIDDRIAAIREIKARFSAEDVPFVIEHFTALKRLDEEKKEAEQTERENWKASIEKETATQAQQRENFRNAALAIRKDLETKMPELYSADPNDPETAKRLQMGYAMLEHKPKTFEEAVALDTRMKMNAAAFPLMAYRYNKMKQERDAALAKVEEINTRGPGVGKKSSGAPAAPGKRAEKEEFEEWAAPLRALENQ